MGYWIKLKGYETWYRCSECGAEISSLPIFFCENCGSAMEKVVKEGDLLI